MSAVLERCLDRTPVRLCPAGSRHAESFAVGASTAGKPPSYSPVHGASPMHHQHVVVESYLPDVLLPTPALPVVILYCLSVSRMSWPVSACPTNRMATAACSTPEKPKPRNACRNSRSISLQLQIGLISPARRWAGHLRCTGRKRRSAALAARSEPVPWSQLLKSMSMSYLQKKLENRLLRPLPAATGSAPNDTGCSDDFCCSRLRITSFFAPGSGLIIDADRFHFDEPPRPAHLESRNFPVRRGRPIKRPLADFQVRSQFIEREITCRCAFISPSPIASLCGSGQGNLPLQYFVILDLL